MELQTIVTLLIGIVVTAVNTYIGVKIKARDEESRKYREEREQQEQERIKIEKKESELARESTLALIRVELRENYMECRDKGFYSMQDREVFHPLYDIYKGLGGNGVVDQWRDELLRLPMEETFGHKVKRYIFGK